MSAHPFTSSSSEGMYDYAAMQARKAYGDAILIAQCTFEYSPDWGPIALLFETQPALGALMTAKRLLGFGEGIVTKVLEQHNKVLSNYLQDDNASWFSALMSLGSIVGPLEMRSRELTGYKLAIDYCKLVDEIDSAEYNISVSDIIEQKSHFANISAKANAIEDQVLSEIRDRSAAKR